MGTKREADWVVMGGRPGELGYCKRCGEGLAMVLPQRISVVAAAAKAFIKVHSCCPDNGRVEPRPATPGEWARGRDTGVSSMTIYSVLTGDANCYGRFDIPHDPDDLGRCCRFLELFPYLRMDLDKVAAKLPEWIPLVREWDRLTVMYEDALRVGDWKPLYSALQALQP